MMFSVINSVNVFASDSMALVSTNLLGQRIIIDDYRLLDTQYFETRSTILIRRMPDLNEKKHMHNTIIQLNFSTDQYIAN
uniref:Uncharacterized protein n=1 Tax=Onchocerca volvulus TaxID=6282 RepID=A0A8R1XP58_ONCVO